MTRRRLRELRDARGSALVEMAIAVPLMLTMLLRMIEFGRTYQVWLQLTHTGSVGARSASVVDTAAGVEARVRNALADLNQGDLTVTVTNAEGASGSDVTVNLLYRHTMITGFFDALFPNGWVDLNVGTTHRLE